MSSYALRQQIDVSACVIRLDSIPRGFGFSFHLSSTSSSRSPHICDSGRDLCQYFLAPWIEQGWAGTFIRWKCTWFTRTLPRLTSLALCGKFSAGKQLPIMHFLRLFQQTLQSKQPRKIKLPNVQDPIKTLLKNPKRLSKAEIYKQ